MNSSNEHTSESVTDKLARSIRFALTCLLLGFCFLNFRAAAAIPQFQQTFADMLEGAALPLITTVAFRGRLLFLALSVLVPLAALATLYGKPSSRTFYAIGALALLTVGQLSFLCSALFAPLSMQLHQLGGIGTGP